jgi:hypothetical protein
MRTFFSTLQPCVSGTVDSLDVTLTKYYQDRGVVKDITALPTRTVNYVPSGFSKFTRQFLLQHTVCGAHSAARPFVKLDTAALEEL